MKRIIMMFIRNFPYLPYYYLKLLYFSHSKKATAQEKFVFLRNIVRHANKGGNVSIAYEGLENIPKENGFIITPNHQGLYDMLAIFDTIDHPISAIVKKELEDIALLKTVLKVMKTLSMDREDVRQSMRVINEAAKQVVQGTNYVIFPEGTRSKNGNKVGEFKAGSFKVATKAKCTILPVALVDSFKPMDTNSTARTTVKIYYLEPLTYEQYHGLQTAEIADIVHERIVNKIAEVTQETVSADRMA